MTVKAALVVTAGILLATPAFAATTHHVRHRSSTPDPILNHSGPISYDELLKIDSGGYNSRGKARHRRMSAPVNAPAPEASPAPDETNPATPTPNASTGPQIVAPEQATPQASSPAPPATTTPPTAK